MLGVPPKPKKQFVCTTKHSSLPSNRIFNKTVKLGKLKNILKGVRNSEIKMTGINA